MKKKLLLVCLFTLCIGVFGAEYILVDLQATMKPCIGYWNVSDHILPLWSDEYKTRYIVLRKIDIPILTDNTPNILANLAPTSSYYIGVFEITQRQWELVMGDRPSYFENDSFYKTRPVERVDYLMVRGKDEITSTSFLGKLGTLTGINGFDLPTQKQWEYACRAGTLTPFHNGRILPEGWEEVLGNWSDDVARTCYNTPNAYLWKPGEGHNKVFWGFGYYERKFPKSPPSYTGTQVVGYYQPNSYGLYDMHGNVAELCLDLSTEEPNASIVRGGSWLYVPRFCTSSDQSSVDIDFVSRRETSRTSHYKHTRNIEIGFRIVLHSTL